MVIVESFDTALPFRYPVDVAVRLRQCNLRHAMKRARYYMYPRAPATLDELGAILEDPANVHIAATKDNTDHLYAGTVGPDGERATIYVSRRMRRVMRKVKEVFSDATFIPTPLRPNGRQVWQIVCLARHNVSIKLSTDLCDEIDLVLSERLIYF